MFTTITSVGRSAEGSNLLTSQTSISATSGKFGCRKFSNDINLIGQPSLSICQFVVYFVYFRLLSLYLCLSVFLTLGILVLSSFQSDSANL